MDGMDQETLELALLIDRREGFERAFEYWRSQIGGVDEPMNDFTDGGNPVVAMLLCQDMWRRLTEAVDRRLARLPGRLL